MKRSKTVFCLSSWVFWALFSFHLNVTWGLLLKTLRHISPAWETFMAFQPFFPHIRNWAENSLTIQWQHGNNCGILLDCFFFLIKINWAAFFGLENYLEIPRLLAKLVNWKMPYENIMTIYSKRMAAPTRSWSYREEKKVMLRKIYRVWIQMNILTTKISN